MVIQVRNLPSGGYNCDVPVININPINYLQILEYDKHPSSTFLLRLKRDMDLLYKDIGEDFMKLPYYDFDMLLLYKKSISVSSNKDLGLNLRYTCDKCNSSNSIYVNVDKLNYTPFDKIIDKIDSVKINNKKYSIKFPSMKDAYKVLNSLMRAFDDTDPKLFLLMCLFDFNKSPNEIKQIIESATGHDIILLEYLLSIYNGCNKSVVTRCSNEKCNSEVIISVNSMMTDFFRLLRYNIKLDPSKIILS